MIIGVPKEIKLQEHRIGLTPESVKVLCEKGHKVLVETKGGLGAGFTDKDYKKSGAHIFIYFSYRNQKVLEDLIKQLKPQNKRISIAIDITGKSEKIITKSVYEFSNSKIILEKKPTIFIFE